MDAIAGHSPPQRPGAILAAERERQGLGPADVAHRLRMSAWQVEALEADDLARLPQGPFLRGFVRNYAKVLGLAPESIVALLGSGSSRDAVPRIVVPSHNIRFDPLSERIYNPYVKAAGIAAIVLSLGFAAMYWWLFIRNTPPGIARKPAAESVAAAPVSPRVEAKVVPPPVVETPPNVAIQKVEAVKAESRKSEPIKAEPVKAEPVKAEPAKAEPLKREPPKTELAVQRVASTGAAGTIKFRFKGSSWVEIKDSGGRVLLTGLNSAGSEAEVSGKLPFRVVVGNAPDVQMFLNDREFNLTPHVHEAVARFTVE